MSSPGPHAQPPRIIVGGCLCHGIRYELHFPVGCAWPPDPHTCQCTMCRQTTGCLVANFITVPVAQVYWHPDSKSGIDPESKLPKSLKKYESSPGHFRSFCSTCGSSIHWHHEEEDGTIESLEMLTGSIDDGSLEAATWKDLSLPTGGNFWFKNAIEGVTDARLGGEGERFTEGSASGTQAT